MELTCILILYVTMIFYVDLKYRTKCCFMHIMFMYDYERASSYY